MVLSALADDREIVCCFFDFHDTSDFPRKTQNPVNERRISGHDPQSASANAFKDRSSVLDRNIPWSGDPLMYHKR